MWKNSPKRPIYVAIPVQEPQVKGRRNGLLYGALGVIALTASLAIDRFWFRSPAAPSASDPPKTFALNEVQPPDPAPSPSVPLRFKSFAPEEVEPVDPHKFHEQREKGVMTEKNLITGEVHPVPPETDKEMIARISTCVVTIKTFRRDGLKPRTQVGSGSGFVVRDKRTIATCFHVVDGVTEVEIESYRGAILKAEGFVYASPDRDIALLRLPAEVIGSAPLMKFGGLFGKFDKGSAPSIQPGERVFAFGSPKGLSTSVTDGIISAVRTTKELGHFIGPDDYGSDPEGKWIQVTAPFAPGSSGGPLVDAKGRVVGMNTVILDPERSQNLNLAIAAESLRQAMSAVHDVKNFGELPSKASPR